MEPCSRAKLLDPATDLLAIRYPGESEGLGIEIHQTNSWNNPGGLKERVSELQVQEPVKSKLHPCFGRRLHLSFYESWLGSHLVRHNAALRMLLE
jgi:hypothetical protein